MALVDGLERAIGFFKVLDLSPAYKEKDSTSRSQLGGFLFFLYLPILFAYLVNAPPLLIAPQMHGVCRLACGD